MTRTLLSLAACAALVPAAFSAETTPPAHTPEPAPATAPKAVKLGELKLDAVKVEIEVAGELVAGKDATFSFTLPAGTAAPKSLHAWVGSPEKSVKVEEKDKIVASADKDGVWSAKLPLPAKLGKHTVLWVVLEPATGAAVTGTLPLHHAQ